MELLIPAAQTFTQQLVMVGDDIAEQGTQVGFLSELASSSHLQQASEYNKLIAPLPAQHQAFNQALMTARVNPPISSKSPSDYRALPHAMRLSPRRADSHSSSPFL
ncbi:DUF3053 family protein [Shigella flexneri]